MRYWFETLLILGMIIFFAICYLGAFIELLREIREYSLSKIIVGIGVFVAWIFSLSFIFPVQDEGQVKELIILCGTGVIIYATGKIAYYIYDAIIHLIEEKDK